MKTLQSVQRETFLPYGEVLEFPAGIEKTFCIITTEEKEPWRLAVFRYTNKEIQRMECHPTSRESFEPLHGLTVLVVATHENPEEYEAFINRFFRSHSYMKNRMQDVNPIFHSIIFAVAFSLRKKRIIYQTVDLRPAVPAAASSIAVHANVDLSVPQCLG